MTPFEQQVLEVLREEWRNAPAGSRGLEWLAPRVAAAIEAAVTSTFGDCDDTERGWWTEAALRALSNGERPQENP